MAGKLEQQIQRIRELQRALEDAGMAAEKVNEILARTYEQGAKFLGYRRRGEQMAGAVPEPSPASVERERNRFITAYQGGNTPRPVISLGGGVRASTTRIAGSLENELANKGIPQLREAFTKLNNPEALRNFETEMKKAMDTRDIKVMADAVLKLAEDLRVLKVAAEQASKSVGTPAAQPTGATTELQKMREYLEALKKDWIALGRSPEDFDKMVNKVVGNSVDNLQKLEEAATKARDKIAEITAASNQANQAVSKVAVSGPPKQTGKNYTDLSTSGTGTAISSLQKESLKVEDPAARDAIKKAITEKIALLNQEILSINKTAAAQAQLNGEQFKASSYVDNVSIKVKKLQGNVVEADVAYRSMNNTVQKSNLYFKQVGTTFEQVADSTEKFTESQRNAFKAGATTPKGQAGYDPQAAAAYQQAQRLGFSEANLNKIFEEGSTKINQYKFAIEQANGAIKTLNVTVDKNGVVLNDTQKRFRSFGDAIVRDIGEVLKWSLAVGVVYGSFQKLQQLIQIAIENQTKLVDITIAMGNAQRSVNDVFADAAQAAQATGETIAGVLEGYTLAYRAAGDIRDPLERTTVANKFLTDSLVLSKLSALDQAEALDTLSGSLKQLANAGETTQETFARSTHLLDTWVATTKAANVDMATLATAFSVTSESAENAGLGIEELNAVIAVMSEKIGALGPKETGNTVRALIGGIYSENAQQQLAKFGVTVQDATGKSRNFLDIMTQLSDLNKAGIVSDDQLNKLALALGGGVRRGQQYLAFITGLGRVHEVAAAQANSDGMAQEALGKQLETVQTSVTRLGNAFQKLAQALGTEGGFLTTAKILLDTLTKMVEVITKLAEITGKAGPILLATLAATSYLGQGDRAGALKGNVGGMFGSLFQNSSILSRRANANPMAVSRGEGIGITPAEWSGYRFGTGFAQKAAPWLAPIASAGMNLAQGDVVKAGANLGGAFLAGIVGGFNPIALAIGSLIGESFLGTIRNWLDTKERDIVSLPNAPGAAPTERKKTPEELALEAQNKQRQQLWEQVYALAGKRSALSNVFGDVATGKAISGLLQGITPGMQGQGGQEYTALGIAGFKGTEGGQGFIDSLKNFFTQRAFLKLSDEDQKLLEDLIKQIDESGQATTKTIENISDRQSINIQNSINEAYKKQAETTRQPDFFEKYAKEQSAIALQQLSKGEISAKEQRNVVSSLPGLPASALQMYTALGGTTKEVGGLAREILGVTDQEQALTRIMDILLHAPEEAAQYIKVLAGDINDLSDLIDKANGGAVKFNDQFLQTPAEQADLLNSKYQELASTLKGLTIEMAQTIKVPNVQMFEDLTKEQFKGVEARARELQQTEYENILPDVSQQKLDEFFSSFEPYFAKTKESYQEIFKLDPKYLQQAFAELEKAGKIATKNISFGFFDAEKYRLAEQYYSKTAANLGKLGYVEDTTPQIVALSDGTIQKTTKDQKIMSLLMSQLVDLSEKQLDGIYNLPTSASFYVPSQAAGMAGRGGGGGIDVSGAEQLANATVIGAETQAQPLTNSLGQATTANYSKFLEEEQKRIEAEAQIAVANSNAQVQKQQNQQPSPWAGLTGPSSQVPTSNQLPDTALANAFSDALEKSSPWAGLTGPSTKLDDKAVQSLDNAFQQLLQQQGGMTGQGDFKGLMDSLNNIKVNSQLELKQNITANVAVILNQAQVGRAVAKYLEEQQLIFSQNAITKNTVI